MKTQERIHKIVKDIICDRAVDCKDCDADETCAFKGIFKDLASALAKEVVFRDEVEVDIKTLGSKLRELGGCTASYDEECRFQNAGNNNWWIDVLNDMDLSGVIKVKGDK